MLVEAVNSVDTRGLPVDISARAIDGYGRWVGLGYVASDATDSAGAFGWLRAQDSIGRAEP